MNEAIRGSYLARICSACGVNRPLLDFYKGSGRCRPCVRRRANQLARRRSESIAYVRGWLIHEYGGDPCADCNVVFPYVAMDFDHRKGTIKNFMISYRNTQKLTPKLLAELEDELTKCDFVCSNCHRIRTYTRKTKELDTL